MTKPVKAEWDRLGGGLCPRCWHKFHGMPAPAKKRARCAGCGRTGKLKGDRCARCQKPNVEPLALFTDAPDPTTVLVSDG